MILRYQSGQRRHTGRYAEPSGSWLQSTNLRWVRTWSLDAEAISTTGSTSVAVRSCITRDLRAVCAEGRWKKFLLLVSPVASLSGPEPIRRKISIAAR